MSVPSSRSYFRYVTYRPKTPWDIADEECSSIGYADGLDRHLGCGKAYCLVNGKEAPYVGNICMDVCMIDVTGIDCKVGDEVEIFGNHLAVSRLSDVLGTIPYEVLTSVSERVARVYFQD